MPDRLAVLATRQRSRDRLPWINLIQYRHRRDHFMAVSAQRLLCGVPFALLRIRKQRRLPIDHQQCTPPVANAGFGQRQNGGFAIKRIHFQRGRQGVNLKVKLIEFRRPAFVSSVTLCANFDGNATPALGCAKSRACASVRFHGQAQALCF